MTTVQEFHDNVIGSLNYLDTVLPAGSHILFVGLVDGRILWNNLHDKPHPLNPNITYAEVYDWLLCLTANPYVFILLYIFLF